jgi:hypothetical protein
MKMPECGRPIRIIAGKAGVPACTVHASEDACFTHAGRKIVYWNLFVTNGYHVGLKVNRSNGMLYNEKVEIHS